MNGQAYVGQELETGTHRGDGALPVAVTQLLTNLVDAAPFAVAVFDAELVCCFVNPAFARVAGGTAKTYIGQSASETLPLPDNILLPDLRRVLATGTPVIAKEVLGEVPVAAGARRTWSIDVHPVPEAGDVQAVCVFLSETTEYHKTESLAHDAIQRLAFHVENTPLAVIEFNRDFEVSLWSARAEIMFGWTVDDVIGKHPSDWPFVVEDDAPTVRRTMDDLLDGVVRNVSHNRNRTKDGRVLFCEWYNSALRDRSGDVISVLSLVQDVTAQHEVTQRQRKFFREMLESLTEGRLCLCDSSEDLPEPLPQVGEPVMLSPRTLRRIRRDVDAVADKVLLTHERKDELVTAVSEAAMNAVVHAGGGQAKVCADVGKGLVQVWIEDKGKGIREDAIHRATLEKGFSSAGSLGHGFWMMLKTADRVFLLTGPHGTTVVLEQSRTPAEPAWLRNARLVVAPAEPLGK